MEMTPEGRHPYLGDTSELSLLVSDRCSDADARTLDHEASLVARHACRADLNACRADLNACRADLNACSPVRDAD